MRKLWWALAGLLLGAAPPAEREVLLRPEQVFDGETVHRGWAVLVRGDRIAVAGPDIAVPRQHAHAWPDRGPWPPVPAPLQ